MVRNRINCILSTMLPSGSGIDNKIGACFSRNGVTRRTLLGALAAAPSLARAQRKPSLPEEFKARLRGPILSFPTVYNQSFGVDFEAVRRIIDTGIRAGVGVVTLTRGNNQYDSLTYEEERQLTRVVVESVGARAAVIAATGPWWTEQAVDFARYATSLGVDAVQVAMPADGTDESYAEHFRVVAASTPRAIVIHGQPSMALWRRLKPIENIVAFKEEFTPDYTLQIYAEFGDRWNIFAGGSKSRLLTYLPYGMRAYYSAFSTFAPQIAMRFWHAVEHSDMAAAAQVVLRYDVPFFERWTMPFWTATLERFGVARRYVRPPAVSFTDAEMKGVDRFYRDLGL